MLAISIVAATAGYGAGVLTPPSVTVGQSLQESVSLTLQEAPTGEGLPIKLTSSDPSRMLLSTSPERAGAASITVTVRKGWRFSPEFFIQGLGKSGSVVYTASAPGLESGAGTVTLAPSGIIFARSGVGVPALRTTTGMGAEVSLHSALLDSSLNYVAPQLVAGGLSVNVNITSSDKRVGTVATSALTIAGGSAIATTDFQPAAPGATALAVSVPPGFSIPAQFATLTATVTTPGMAVTDGVAIGQNLQIDGTVILGELAPAGGVEVKLTSSDPSQLLLSATPGDVGSGSITIRIPAGAANAPYYLQGIGNAGTVTTTAVAPGYLKRTGTITLARSGVVIGGPPGPPDEAELFSKEVADGPHGFLARLSERAPVHLLVYTVQLDPETHRSADLTVQPLRPGVSLTATLHNSNPAIGKVHTTSVIINAGSHTATTEFTPSKVGSTVISVATPEGFHKSANATSITVVVAQ
jgi:hypothetical protein